MNEELERIAKDVVDASMKLHMALGREVTLADREHVDAIYNSIVQEDFSLRAAIHAIVAHPEFGRK